MIYLILALLYDKYALCMNFEEMRIEARSRTKPEETLVEVRSDSDVQIDRQTWV